MNKKQLTDTIGQAIRDLELAEQRILELEAEVARLKAMLPNPDWDNAPELAEWHAVDRDGMGWWYVEKPMSGKRGYFAREGFKQNNNVMSHYAPHSLQRRPTRKDDNE